MAGTAGSKRTTDKSAKGDVKVVFLCAALLGIHIFTVFFHRITLGTQIERLEGQSKYEPLKKMKLFRAFFFTGWNFALQIVFLILAIVDETSKLVNFSGIQRKVEKVRLYLFSTFVFPCSLLVVTVFWSIWHIDRELIFPKAIDDFYPSWLNHTLHTFILIPLLVEILLQMNNKNYRTSRWQAALTLTFYCTIYQSLFMYVYFAHGVWLYPIYKVLDWTQRIAFTLLQFAVVITYQQIGISLLSSNTSASKTKIK